MLYLLFTHMECCTDAEVERLLPLVSCQRREEALRYTHTFGRYCCLKSYEMLRCLVASVSPTMEDCPLEFTYSEHGKPFLKARPDIHFSISHTKNAILVAISDKPIGVDVERFRHPSDGLLEKTMNADEQAMIAAASSQDAMFTALWTKKEAVLKLRGTGIVDDLHGALGGNEQIETRVDEHGEFAMSIAQ